MSAPIHQTIFAALGSLLPRRRPRGADATTRILRPWRDDALRQYPATGLTPKRATAFLQVADAGSPHILFEFFAEMLSKWPRLAAVEATRRLALTGLDWEIENADPRSAARADSRGANSANDSRVADFCRESLNRIPRFRDALDHLANAIGYGVAVCELVWDSGRLIDIVPVPYSRLIADPHEPWRLRIRTEDEPALGVAIDEQPLKWLVHEPGCPHAGRLFAGALLRASLPLFVAQNIGFKHWLVYSEIAGMPVRYAQFDASTTEDEKQQLFGMLQKLGTDAVAAFSKGIDIKLLEGRSAGDKPYQPMQEYCNTEVTILWLGQHLTTDIKNSGSRAAAEVHDRVREDLLVDDIKAEGETIRRGVLTPVVAARFGDGVSVPRFRRSLIESVDTKVLADTLAVAIRDLGLRVPAGWAHQALGIPKAAADEAVLTP